MNTSVGIALSILRHLKKDTEIFVTEVGAYRRGEIKRASWYIPFKYAVLTGLGNQHLDLYGSRENLVHEESSLLYQIPRDGKVYINTSTQLEPKITDKITAQPVTCGIRQGSIRAQIKSIGPSGIRAQIWYQRIDFMIETQLLGEHSLVNLLPAIAIALDLGMKPGTIKAQIASLRPITGKLSLHTGKAKATIIHDGVNSNVDGFIAAIRVLEQFPQKTKYIVSQGIIELGVEKQPSYERILKELSKTQTKLLTTDSLFSSLDKEKRVMIFNDVSDLQKKLNSLINKQSVVLIEGKFPEPVIKNLLNHI
jgi:UDP-N-acetylmuramoyl-tripeptide--D-alanyl-D-alanine ligase